MSENVRTIYCTDPAQPWNRGKEKTVPLCSTATAGVRRWKSEPCLGFLVIVQSVIDTYTYIYMCIYTAPADIISTCLFTCAYTCNCEGRAT